MIGELERTKTAWQVSGKKTSYTEFLAQQLLKYSINNKRIARTYVEQLYPSEQAAATDGVDVNLLKKLLAD